MFEINKKYILDENQNPIAVQISLEDLAKIEEVLENFGLAKLMKEIESDDLLSGKEACNYYEITKLDLEEKTQLRSDTTYSIVSPYDSHEAAQKLGILLEENRQ